jgi:beta-glucosidase
MRKISQLVKVMAAVLFSLQMSSTFAQVPVYQNPKEPINKRVEDLLSKMTLEEKIGQMTQADNTAVKAKPEDIANYFMGSILSGGDSKTGDNTTKAWAEQYNSFQNQALSTRLKIPIIYGLDAVHGNNDVYGTTIFPHNIALGCTRNPDLVEKAARVTAEEVLATGSNWAFAPCIAVTRDERWGRTYESFGETPELAEIFGAAQVRGLQGASLAGKTSVLACAKHYLGDGGTTGGKDQGNTVADEAAVRKLFLPGYIPAIKAGVGSVMASYSSINGIKMHGSKFWLTDVLKKELGFEGFVVSDWAGVDQLNPDYTAAVDSTINAGVDMVMLPNRYVDFFSSMKSLVSSNKISIARIDDAVRRILTIKFKMGLFEHPMADASLVASVGSAEHRAVARQCVRESLVLLKKTDGVLPLPKSGKKILVAGSHADDLGNQCGGWSIAWQGKSGNTTIGTTILAGMKKAAPGAKIDFSAAGDFADSKADYSVVVIGEKPYAEGKGDTTDLSISKDDVALIKKMKSYGAPVIVILISGRPLIIEKIQDNADAIFAAWLPGTEGDGVSDVLFGDFKPKGLLSVSWPKSMDQVPINIGDANYAPLFEFGYGLTSF